MPEQGSFFAGKKVLVTGAGGFIGPYVSSALVQQGAEVHGTWRRYRPPHRGAVHWRNTDLRSLGAVEELVNEVEPEVIFHLASHVAGARGIELVEATFQDNLTSSVNLLLASARGCRCRLVFAGSLEEPQRDSDETPSSPYAAAKWAAAGYARMFHRLYGIPVCLARIFMVYGPGQRDLTKLIPYTVLCLLDGKPPEVTSGSRQVDWIYAEDVAAGLLALAASDEVDGRPADLGSGSFATVRDVVEGLCRIVNPAVALSFGARPDRGHEQVRMADVETTRARIGWYPTTSLEDGLRKTAAWYGDPENVRSLSS